MQHSVSAGPQTTKPQKANEKNKSTVNFLKNQIQHDTEKGQGTTTTEHPNKSKQPAAVFRCKQDGMEYDKHRLPDGLRAHHGKLPLFCTF